MNKHLKLIACLSRLSFARALGLYRVAAGIEHTHALKPLADLRTILDVGANRGQFALAARAFCPKADVISFEPLRAPAAMFRKVHGPDPRVTLVEAAVGSQEEQLEMHVSGRDDSSSFLPATNALLDHHPDVQEVAREMVRVAPLRNLVDLQKIRQPALLKIDVQGFELQVLQGCEDVLALFQFVYVECSYVETYADQALAPELWKWLEQRGYILRGSYNESFNDGKPFQSDCLFERQSAGLNPAMPSCPATQAA